MKIIAAGGIADRLRAIFPDREFFMRSQGQVRFIKVSSGVQIAAAAIVAILLLAWLGSMAVMSISQFTTTRDRQALLHREAKVESAEHRVKAYRKDIKSVETDLAKRQDFIEKMVEAHIGDLPAAGKKGETASNSSGETARTIKKISMAVPEAAGLAHIEARQLALVERLTRFANRRADRDAETIRKLGLNPKAMVASFNDRSAEGGPLLRLATSTDGSLDPRFERLGVSLARMDALEDGLTGLPQVLPTSMESISSGFGYRTDPFTGAPAFHPGIDFRGPVGAPVYAAANGLVIFAGLRGGYGNCIEINHGNGLITRYGHMSRLIAHVGEKVTAGQVIGAIGSTGRSTGPHLHFEVRVDGHPVNPRPFLEAAPDVLKEIKHRA